MLQVQLNAVTTPSREKTKGNTMMPRPACVVWINMIVWAVLSVILCQQALGQPSDWENNIHPGMRIESGYFLQTDTANHCKSIVCGLEIFRGPDNIECVNKLYF